MIHFRDAPWSPGVRHLRATYDLAEDKLYGHIRKTQGRMIRRSIIWRDKRTADLRFRKVVAGADIG
ncbi:hypothetical protein [Streptomyces globisporus]|uniref:hypothetical protein n=1 Tax=Streptomyces globisporus TaxID=1908 RepID=UPI0004CB3136|nr:hypothetical protein [Streptomyces globisporus]